MGLTPADLMTLPAPANGRHYELSDGELIVVGNSGFRRELIKSRVLRALFAWAGQNPQWKVFAETQFTLGERTARIPNAAVVSAEKLALLVEADVATDFAPNLAVEVVSVSESEWDAERKVSEYLEADVEEVWQECMNFRAMNKCFPEEKRMIRLKAAERRLTTVDSGDIRP